MPNSNATASLPSEAAAGVDVSKDALDLCILPLGLERRFPNDRKGVRALLRLLLDKEARLVALEASGGYERGLRAELDRAGLPAACVEPRRVRRFAQALGVLAKTDRIDARVLARFARDARPEPRPLPEPERRALRELLERRSRLIEMRVAEKSRRDRAEDPWVRRSAEAHLRQLERAVAAADAELRRRIEARPDWAASVRLLRSAPGVGEVVAPVLLAALPELGSLGRGEIAALAGLAPFPRESGTLRGKRFIRGGRAEVRRALYMAALVAVFKAQGTLRDFYLRLVQRGKPKKLALAAVMRKLLVALNAIVRKNSPWTTSPA